MQTFPSVIDRKPLSRTEESALVARWFAGDRAARDRVILASTGAIYLVARRYFPRGVPEDVVQVGYEALAEAANHYDPARGVRFMSYAVYWIRALVFNWMMAHDCGSMRVGTTRQQRQMFCRLRRAQEGDVDLETVADRLGVTVEDVRWFLPRITRHDPSIDEPHGNGRFTYAETLADDHAIDPSLEAARRERARVLHVKLRIAMRTLTDRERRIVETRFLREEDKRLTLSDLGEKLGVSRERVRQIEEIALEKLRRAGVWSAEDREAA